MAYMYKYSLIGILLNFAFMAVSVPSNAYPMTIAATIFSAVGWNFAGIGLFGIQLELLNERKGLTCSFPSSPPLEAFMGFWCLLWPADFFLFFSRQAGVSEERPCMPSRLQTAWVSSF